MPVFVLLYNYNTLYTWSRYADELNCNAAKLIIELHLVPLKFEGAKLQLFKVAV